MLLEDDLSLHRISEKSGTATVVSSTGGQSTNTTYYYEGLGQDSIDPLYVTFDDQKATAGNTIEVKIWQNDGAKNNSYGQISYDIEINNNNTGWQSATTVDSVKGSDLTTATLTIPSDSTSWKVRVRAKDSLGFTSSVYVYGNGIE